jgi:formylglycine-generating enzyme
MTEYCQQYSHQGEDAEECVMADRDKPNFLHLMLELPEDVTSPDYYELLSLDRFESDEQRIREVAIDANQKLLAWQNSQYHAECNRLMDMVVRSRDVLLNSVLKARYDERLRERLGIDELVDEDLPHAPTPASARVKPVTEEETAPDYDKVFLLGLGGLVVFLVLVGLVVIFVRDSGERSDPVASELPPLLESSFSKMSLVLILPGEFQMGSPESDTNAYGHEKPQHLVRITKAFYLQTTEVTQGQFEAVMGTTPWRGELHVKEGPEYAASYVSWDDAQEFCRLLSEKDGKTYRLPTEAEWEYACRAGTSTVYFFSDDASHLGEYAWWGGITGNGNCRSEQYAHEVRQKQPNAFGLHDMHGNVREWCQDCYGNYVSPPASDPVGPSSGSSRVFRGGCWDDPPVYCRSAYRNWNAPSDRDDFVGFRVAHSPVR